MHKTVVLNKFCALSSLSCSRAAKDEENDGFWPTWNLHLINVLCQFTKLSRVETTNKIMENLAGLVKVVIGQAELKDFRLAHYYIHLTLCITHTGVDLLCSFSAALLESRPELFDRRRQD